MTYGRTGQSVFAFIVAIQYAQDIEQGTLARPRRTHNGYELALPDIQVDALQYVKGRAVIVRLVYAF